MEDFEAQELEFWARLSEEGMSRSQMLRRSAAAAFGLTVLAAPASALASRARLGGSTLPASGAGLSMSELVSEAKKEGHAQHDRSAARLGELRRDHQHVQDEVRARA